MKMLILSFISLVKICNGNPTVNYVSPLMDEMQRAPLVAVLNTSDISKNILENLEKQLTTRVKQIVEDTVGDIIRQQIDAKFKEIGIANDTAKKDVFVLENYISHTNEGNMFMQ